MTGPQTLPAGRAARPLLGPDASPPGGAERRRYLEGGLVDLACDHCGGLVRVKKNSVEQTSVQWTVAAAQRCAEFAMRRETGQARALVATCGRLRASIDKAVAEGRLMVEPPDGTPVEPPEGTPVEVAR